MLADISLQFAPKFVNHMNLYSPNYTKCYLLFIVLTWCYFFFQAAFKSKYLLYIHIICLLLVFIINRDLYTKHFTVIGVELRLPGNLFIDINLLYRKCLRIGFSHLQPSLYFVNFILIKSGIFILIAPLSEPAY